MADSTICRLMSFSVMSGRWLLEGTQRRKDAKAEGIPPFLPSVAASLRLGVDQARYERSCSKKNRYAEA